MLHGEVKINSVVIHQWTARRLQSLVDVTQISDYECTFSWEQPFMGYVTFPICHRYDAGAAALATKVIHHGRALMDAQIEAREV